MNKVDKIYPPNKVSLREVGLRDGMQMVKAFPSTAAKKRWVETEYAAGVRHFEVGSFLPHERYPVFADVSRIIDVIAGLPGAHGVALTLNKRGINDALASGVGEIGCVISASEEHNQANIRQSREQTLGNIKDLCRMRDNSDHKPLVSVGIAMSFGCSIAGKIAASEVLAIADRCYAMGVDIVSIADTVGYAGPKQVAELSRDLSALAAGKPFGVHLHDTRGMGIANAAAALNEGVRVLDGAMGGLGGCPFAPGSSGNIVFEDLVYLCISNGLDVNIDLEYLVKVRDIIQDEMPSEPLHGAVAKAGIPLAGIP